MGCSINGNDPIMDTDYNYNYIFLANLALSLLLSNAKINNEQNSNIKVTK